MALAPHLPGDEFDPARYPFRSLVPGYAIEPTLTLWVHANTAALGGSVVLLATSADLLDRLESAVCMVLGTPREGWQ